jgi:hypothetical protein
LDRHKTMCDIQNEKMLLRALFFFFFFFFFWWG